MRLRNLLFILILLFIPMVSYSQRIMNSEVLGRCTNNSIVIQMMFGDSSDVKVEYGTSPGTFTSQTTWQVYPDSINADISINGLSPNTTYYYRVNTRKHNTATVNTLGEHYFHTQRGIMDSFVFTVQADPHMDASSDTTLYKVCLQNQLNDHPDFMIDLGDFLMTDKLKNSANQVPFDTIPYRCNLLRRKYETICHSVPLFIALGNHEGEAGWYNTGTANNIAVWDTKERKKYFPNPFPDGFYTGDTTHYPYVGQRASYYAWTWGDALFVVLDPYWFTKPKPDSLNGWRWTLGKEQYDWLKQTLEQSTADYKFVFAHQMVGGDPDGRGGVEFAKRYEWGGYDLDDTTYTWNANRPGWYKPIKDLFKENKVNVFFHGHDHFFAKQERECLIYQETPQPSLPIFNYPNSAAPYGYLEGLILGNTGHLKVSVNNNYTKIEYVKAYRPSQENSTRHNGDIVATYFIKAHNNCYDSLNTGSPLIWNSEYFKEVVYPNPTQESTSIAFNLEKADQLTITIYNIQGKLVRKIMDNETLASGHYIVNWDGQDFLHNTVQSGTYLYTIESANKAISNGKIILTH